MELTADIAAAIATQFSKPLNDGTYIGELPQKANNAYLVIPVGSPDAPEWNGGLQVQNFQQFDVYSFSNVVQTAYNMAFDARRFLGCLSCLSQHIENNHYVLKGVKTIGGVSDLGKTAENKQICKFTVQITYLAAC